MTHESHKKAEFHTLFRRNFWKNHRGVSLLLVFYFLLLLFFFEHVLFAVKTLNLLKVDANFKFQTNFEVDTHFLPQWSYNQD